jgi:four helix bundle protein
MGERQGKYDLEDRTFRFALSVRKCVSGCRWTPTQWTDVNQLLRASGSVPANYGEANNSVSAADFLHRIRIAKKEANECRLWTRLLSATCESETTCSVLSDIHQEAAELVRILATIDRNAAQRKPET